MTSKQFLVVDYFFEKEIPIEFHFSGNMNNTISTTLSSIMGSKAQTFIKTIEGTDLVFEVKGLPYRTKIYSIMHIDVEIEGKVSEKSLRYRIISKGTKEKQVDQALYLSELIQVAKNLNKVNFKQCVIPDICVTPDEDYNNCKISIELFNFQKNKSLGIHSCILSSLLHNKTPIKFDDKITGIISIDPIKNYSFIDYLIGGLQICLSFAIDFTASNENPTDPKSLHYLSPYNS